MTAVHNDSEEHAENPCRMRGNSIYRSGPGSTTGYYMGVQPERSLAFYAVIRQ